MVQFRERLLVKIENAQKGLARAQEELSRAQAVGDSREKWKAVSVAVAAWEDANGKVVKAEAKLAQAREEYQRAGKHVEFLRQLATNIDDDISRAREVRAGLERAVQTQQASLDGFKAKLAELDAKATAPKHVGTVRAKRPGPGNETFDEFRARVEQQAE